MPPTTRRREKLWSARKALSPALRTLAPGKINEDVVVPVSRIPFLVDGVGALSREFALPIVCFGHAGNGNLHVNILFDPADAAQSDRAQAALARVFALTLSLGGTLSGEHGIGLAKRDFMPQAIDPATLALMRQHQVRIRPGRHSQSRQALASFGAIWRQAPLVRGRGEAAGIGST